MSTAETQWRAASHLETQMERQRDAVEGEPTDLLSGLAVERPRSAARPRPSRLFYRIWKRKDEIVRLTNELMAAHGPLRHLVDPLFFLLVLKMSYLLLLLC